MGVIWKKIVNTLLTLLLLLWVALLVVIGTFVDDPWKKRN